MQGIGLSSGPCFLQDLGKVLGMGPPSQDPCSLISASAEVGAQPPGSRGNRGHLQQAGAKRRAKECDFG